MRLKANAAYVTDVGRLREQNQDAAGIAQNQTSGWPIFVVADGMGGHAAGEIAANLTIESVIETLTDAAGDGDPDEQIRRGVELAHQRIQDEIAAHPDKAGMGTTCLVALLAGRQLHLGHIGDSRAYLFRDGRLEQITSDHSWVNEQIRAGLLSPAEAARHPMRHVITRALGPEPVDTELVHRELEPGDWLLLCSDGLTGPLADDTIAAVLAEADHPEVSARRLVELANEAGGPDNITVLLVHLETVAEPEAGSADPEPAPPAAQPARRFKPHLLVLVALVVIALIIAGAILLLRPANPVQTFPPPLPTLPPASQAPWSGEAPIL